MDIHTIANSQYIECNGLSFEVNTRDNYKGWVHISKDGKRSKGLNTRDALELLNEQGGRIKPALIDSAIGKRKALAMLANG